MKSNLSKEKHNENIFDNLNKIEYDELILLCNKFFWSSELK